MLNILTFADFAIVSISLPSERLFGRVEKNVHLITTSKLIITKTEYLITFQEKQQNSSFFAKQPKFTLPRNKYAIKMVEKVGYVKIDSKNYNDSFDIEIR